MNAIKNKRILFGIISAVILLLIGVITLFLLPKQKAQETLLNTGTPAVNGDVLVYGAFLLDSDTPEYDKIILENNQKILYKNDQSQGTCSYGSKEIALTFDISSQIAGNKLLFYEDSDSDTGKDIFHTEKALSEQYLAYLIGTEHYTMNCYVATSNVLDCYLTAENGKLFRFMYVRLTESSGITIFSELNTNVTIPTSLEGILGKG